jgi:nucleotide-binding universal stress UspA family protein
MNVLVAHDGSVQAAKALDVAIQISGKFGGKLDIVTVVPDLCLASEELSSEECDMVASSLATEAKGQIKNGRPAEGIVEAAKELKSELIVVGSHGKHGAAKMFLGSVSSRVAEMADVSTLIVK